MRQRYYDPSIGAMLSVDPVTAYDTGDWRQFNRYAYAFNNPYRFKDPDGRAPCDACDYIRNDPMLLPEGTIVRTAGEAIAAVTAYGVGVATGDQNLQSAAVEGMRENVTARDGLNAAMVGVGPRGGRGVASGRSGPRASGPVFATTRQATAAAKAMGFSKTNATVKGEAVFKRGSDYITRDNTGHNGGAWKMADSVKALGSKDTRVGTYSADLKKRIGD